MSKFKLGILLGIAIGLCVTAAVAIYLLRDPIPLLTKDAYDSAVARWQEKKLEHYDMHVVFSGGQIGEYDVQVRGGKVTRLVRDGQPLQDRGAAWQLWTVPGMFEILDIDLARLENPTQDPAAGEVRISAEFDPEWGFPRRYRQIQLGGKQVASEWHITQFTPVTSG